jgi:hypothetical protein
MRRDRQDYPALAAGGAPLLLLGLTLVAVTVTFVLSPFALERLGINYVETGGPLFEKIHPATYLMAMALLARLALERHPTRFLVAAMMRRRGATIFLWTVASLIAYAVANLHVPISLLVDTFVFPLLVLALLDGIDETSARLLARLIHVIFAANAVLGLFEMAAGWRLTPIIIRDLDLTTLETRSSALFGHPLANAILTGLYAIILAVGGGRDLPGWARFPVMALQLAAMFCFGGRLATVATLFLITLLGLRQLGLILAGRRFRAGAALYLAALPAMLVAVAGAYAGGFFDVLLDRFVSDQGSAQVRVVMLELFSHFTWYQLLFGPDQDLLHSVMFTEGTELGVESFWVSFLLTYGAVPSLVFFLGFGAFLFDLSTYARRGVGWAIVYFLIVVSGSLSIGDKTLALGAMVVLAMILLRPPETERAALAWPRRRIRESGPTAVSIA